MTEASTTQPQGLRIFMVGPFPDDPERVVGGVESATVTLARALADHPDIAKVLVASPYAGRRKAERLEVGPKLEVRHVRVPFINGDSLVRCLPAVWAMRGLVRAFRPDVAHGQGIGRMGEIATQLGLPAVVTVHGLVHVEARVTERNLLSRLKAASLDAAVARTLARAEVVVSISQYDTREIGHLIRGERVSIPNAVAEVFFEAPSPPPPEPVVFFGGLIRERKNVIGLVDAFEIARREVGAARLVVAGPVYDSAYQERLARHVSERGLDGAVDLVGHLSFDRLVAAMREATAVALFSEEETLPTVIAQAMALGRPVLASDVGGITDMVEQGRTGFTVRSGDVPALAARMVELLSSHPLRMAFGARAATVAASRWRAGAVADQTVDAYRKALARRG